MSLTPAQTTISDLFASRANSSQNSRAFKRRAESAAASAAGDFGSLFAGFGSRPQAEVSLKQSQSSDRTSATDATRRQDTAQKTADRQRSRETKELQNNLRQKAATHNTKRNSAQNTVNDTKPRDVNVSSTKSHKSTRPITAEKSLSDSQLAKNQQSNATNGQAKTGATPTPEGSAANATALSNGRANGVSVDALNAILLNEDSGQFKISDLGLSVTTELIEQRQPTSALSEVSTGATLGSLKASLEQKMLARAGVQLESPLGKSDLLNSTALLQEFDIRQGVDSDKIVKGASNTDSMKALEQLNSVKSIAPNVMRALVANSQEGSEAKQTSRPSTKGSSRNSVVSSATGVLVAENTISGVNPNASVNGVNEAANMGGKPQDVAKDFLALQKGGAGDAIVIDGKNVTLDGAVQLQSESGESKSSAKASAKGVGKLVIPTKFGSALKSGVTSLKLQISPESLGDAQLTVKLIKNLVRGTLTVTSEAAKAAALGSLDALADRLSREGLTLDALNVEVSQDGSGEGQQELEQRYNDTLQSGLIHRAFNRSDESTRLSVTERVARPLMMNVVSPHGIDALA